MNAAQVIGDILFKYRSSLNETQDEFGKRYQVSAPAIFKFEKAYVKPAMKLWIKMAQDAGVPQKRAVLLWAKAKLPRQYQEYLDLQSTANQDDGRSERKRKQTEFGKLTSRAEIQELIRK